MDDDPHRPHEGRDQAQRHHPIDGIGVAGANNPSDELLVSTPVTIAPV
jgi:hypothetical protein